LNLFDLVPFGRCADEEGHEPLNIVADPEGQLPDFVLATMARPAQAHGSPIVGLLTEPCAAVEPNVRHLDTRG
jgi:hypothetical protein